MPAVSAVAEVVEAAFCVGEESAGGGAHAVAIGPFDDVGGGRKSSASDRVLLGTSPETEYNEIGLLGLPPEWVSNVLLRNPENGGGGMVWRV